MPERSAISQAVQIGVEATATPGTPVAASRRLGSLGVELGVASDIKSRRPVGNKYANLAVLGKEWSEASLSGAPVYTELPYLLASVVSNPTTAAIVAGAGVATGGTRWTFASSNFDRDTPRTFTVEQGDSVRAHRASHGLITDLSMSWSREDIELGGSMMARRLEDGIAMTTGATMLDQVPVRPSELSVYLDTKTPHGVTKRGRVISGEFGLGSRFLPVWVVDAAQDSFVGAVEGEPEVSWSMLEQADAAGMDNLVRMRAGGTAFLRLHAQGPVIFDDGTTKVRHEMILDVAGQITEPNPFSEEDGIYAIEWGFGGVYNPGWGHAFRAEVVTTTSAL